jgi:hypothetical protein
MGLRRVEVNNNLKNKKTILIDLIKKSKKDRFKIIGGCKNEK